MLPFNPVFKYSTSSQMIFTVKIFIYKIKSSDNLRKSEQKWSQKEWRPLVSLIYAYKVCPCWTYLYILLKVNLWETGREQKGWGKMLPYTEN